MRSIPVVILGGSDRRPARLPESGAALHPLAEYKGASIQVGGRPLVELLVERLNAAEGFGPVTITGPARVYGPLELDAEVIDSDGSVATNLRASIEGRGRPGQPLALLACDVLPTRAELEELRRSYESAPCHLWLPFVRRPADPARLGVFAWKPTYPMIPPAGGEPVRILPGHLCIFEPDALRLPLLYRLMDAAYRTRNRSLARRRSVLLGTGISGLLAIDLSLLVRLRAPNRTVTTVSSGLLLARQLRSGRLRVEELEEIIARIFLRQRLRDIPPAEGIRFPFVDHLSLAEDIDTEEEARALE